LVKFILNSLFRCALNEPQSQINT